MSRFSSLSAPIRQSLLERDNPFDSFDPFGPLDEVRRQRRPVSLPLAAPVGPPNLPKTRNRAGDVGRVEGALRGAGVLGGGKRRRPVFDTRLETGVRDFQRQKGLRVDGLLNPGGPTIRALGRVLARPPLRGLSGAAVSANTRLVRHLMTTTADGIVPDLMAGDFRTNEAGRAKTADFLSQLFRRDPARAKSLRAKAKAWMAAGDNSLLDKLILQARLFEEGDPDDDEDDPTPEDPEDKSDKPKPDKEKCQRLKVELANAEQAKKEAQERARKADAEFTKWSEEADRLRTSLRNGLIQLGIEFAPDFLRIIGFLKRLSRKRPADAQTILNLVETAQKMFEAEKKGQ